MTDDRADEPADLPRYRPICPVCTRPFPAGGDRGRLSSIRRRIAWLRENQIPFATRVKSPSLSWLLEEASALEWAVSLLEPPPSVPPP